MDPIYSPDGRRIAFVRQSVTANFDVWLMDAGRSTRVRVTSHAAADVHPTWSADGRFLYFLSERSGRFDIFRLRSTVPYGKAQPIPRAASLDGPTNCSGEWTVDFAWIDDITVSPLGDYIGFGLSRQIREGPCFYNPVHTWARARLDGTEVSYMDNEVGCPNWGPGGTSLAGIRRLSTIPLGYRNQVRTFRSDQDGEKVVFTETTDGTFSKVGCPAWSPRGASI